MTVVATPTSALSRPGNGRQSWMNMVDRAPTTPGPRPELGAFELAREDFAHRWAAAISAIVLANVSRAELEQLLADFTDGLHAALTSEPFTTVPARWVGRAMVDADLISSVILERSVQFIGEHLISRSVLGRNEGLPGRLVAVLGAVGAGFAEGLRDRTMDQQEVSKTAAINTIWAAEDALRASEAKFRAVFSSSALGIAVTELDGRLIDVNEALLNLLDYSAEQLRTMTARDLVHPDDRAALDEAIARLEAIGGEHFRTEKRMVRSDGDTIATLMAVSLVRDRSGKPAYHVTMVENMNEVKALQSQLVRQSLHDVLTMLPNRAQFLGWLEGAVGWKGPEALALLHIDVDGFRVLNDAFGHEAGNRILQAVANHLNSVFGEVGQVARIGADEFGVLIKDPADVRSVIGLVEEAVELLAEPVYVGDNGIAVTVSVGIVVHWARGADAAELLRVAGVTVGWAKRDGKAQWALYDPDREHRDRERFVLAASIPGALEQGEFRIDYQPVHSLADRRVIAVEAQLRWQHPEHGVLTPDRFLDVTMQTGVIVRLGRWAVETACRQAGQWYAEFGDAAPVLSMDLTARQCLEPELVADVRRILNEAGLPAGMLQFELNERLVATLNEEQLEDLDILAGHGVRLVLDQLGGASMCADRFRQLPVHGVKFTGSAVHGLDENADRIEETAAVALLTWAADVLEVELLAEDVLTDTEARRLAELGVTGAQGPFFGETVTAEEIHRRLSGSW
jgi:diguanylate cyclase (GGDEF)-like protein/PAS domain S-box-containing protein